MTEESKTMVFADAQDSSETKEKTEAETPKKTQAAPASVADKDKEIKIPSKFKKIVEEVESMSVLDLNELVKIFEKKFGVSATAVAVAGPASAEVSADEEKTTADVELSDGGANKIAVIKVIKEALGLGLKEAKDLVDGAPAMLKIGMKKEEAGDLKKKIEEAGGKVTLK